MTSEFMSHQRMSGSPFPMDNLWLVGPVEGETETKERFKENKQQYDGALVEQWRPKSNLGLPSRGDLGGSEAAAEYSPKFGRRAQSSRKGDNLLLVKHDPPAKKEKSDFIPVIQERTLISRGRRDNLRTVDLPLEVETEQKSRFTSPKHDRCNDKSLNNSH